jgi:hypothetical protein
LSTARPRTFAVVALVAAASMGFELVQTRVLSALYFNNLVYMTVTIALLGFGVSGVLAAILYRRLRGPEDAAALLCGGLGLSIPLCLCAASSLPGAFPEVNPVIKMIVSYFILVVPFVCGGGALALTFMRYGSAIFGLYWADLSASAATAVLFSLLLRPLGAPDFAWLCSAAAVAAFALAAPSSGRRRAAGACAALLLAGFLLCGQGIVRNQPEPYKVSGKFFGPGRGDTKLEASVWTTIAKIDVWSNPHWVMDSPIGRLSGFMRLTQDNDAHTVIWGKEPRERFRKAAAAGIPTMMPTLAYSLRPKPKDVLVIGVGGGGDIMAARAYGAQNIDGAEINVATTDLLRTSFADYAQWPRWNGVTLYNSEGRHFARLADKKYDVIVMSAVDTFAALSSGAYVLSENYLYTVEAMRDYMNALKPDGVMVIFRWFFPYPREDLRLANLFLSAAETDGGGAPDRRMLVMHTDNWAGTFLRRRPFTAEEVQTMCAKARGVGFHPIYLPKVMGAGQARFEAEEFAGAPSLAPAREAYAALVAAPGPAGRKAFADAYPYRIDPVYDDRPFFFEYFKAGSLDPAESRTNNQRVVNNDLSGLRGPIVHYVLYILLAVTLLVNVFAVVLPLAVFERDGLGLPRRWGLVGFFSALGVGFMFVEIGCMQWLNLYLGHPMYSLMVVLSALLVYAGAGSCAAGGLAFSPLQRLRLGMIGSAALIPAWLLAMKYAIPLTERWSLAGRISVVLLSLLPLGFCMGMPFATGIRYLTDRHARFIPWAWGINGITSVAASILAVILAMNFGFTVVVLSGAAVYMAGYFAMQHHLGAPARRPS